MKLDRITPLLALLLTTACSEAGVAAVEAAEADAGSRAYACLDQDEYDDCQDICGESTDSFEEYYSCGGVCFTMRCDDVDPVH